MEITYASNRLHPLIAGAAVSVITVSLLGAAAIAGIIPSSHGTIVDPARSTAQAPAAAPASPALQVAETPAEPQNVTRPKSTAHYHHVVHHVSPAYTQVAQAQPVNAYPVQQAAPEPHNSPVGIGVGAVVGGLVGSQIGGGNGKTLATIAGAVGGGYLGNEIAKRNQ
jgi:uncharacterized protein YcfJ